MANKQSFTPEEWNKIVESVALAGMAVTAAEPSGLIGLVKESFANAGAMFAAKDNPKSNELAKAVVAEFESSDGRTAIREAMKARFAGAKKGDISRRAVEALREVSAIVDRKAPADAPAFKQWLHTISGTVAAAASEGGVLGIGGEKVSPAEKATLDDIAKALGVAA